MSTAYQDLTREVSRSTLYGSDVEVTLTASAPDATPDVDGFNLAYAVTHETFVDVVELLVPELQKRGVYKTEYAPGTLREKLFGDGPRLPASHPGAAYRDLGRLHGPLAAAALA